MCLTWIRRALDRWWVRMYRARIITRLRWWAPASECARRCESQEWSSFSGWPTAWIRRFKAGHRLPARIDSQKSLVNWLKTRVGQLVAELLDLLPLSFGRQSEFEAVFQAAYIAHHCVHGDQIPQTQRNFLSRH